LIKGSHKNKNNYYERNDPTEIANGRNNYTNNTIETYIKNFENN